MCKRRVITIDEQSAKLHAAAHAATSRRKESRNSACGFCFDRSSGDWIRTSDNAYVDRYARKRPRCVSAAPHRLNNPLPKVTGLFRRPTENCLQFWVSKMFSIASKAGGRGSAANPWVGWEARVAGAASGIFPAGSYLAASAGDAHRRAQLRVGRRRGGASLIQVGRRFSRPGLSGWRCLNGATEGQLDIAIWRSSTRDSPTTDAAVDISSVGQVRINRIKVAEWKTGIVIIRAEIDLSRTSA